MVTFFQRSIKTIIVYSYFFSHARPR
jgi:hypothetical protein